MKLLFTSYMLAMEMYNKTNDREWKKIANEKYDKIKELLQNTFVEGNRKYYIVIEHDNSNLNLEIFISMRDTRNIKNKLNEKFGIINQVIKA